MRKSPAVELVPAESYKPLLPKARRKAALAALSGSETLAKATRVIALKTAELRSAVLELVDRMEAAAGERNWPAAFEAAHEIRGLAGTAGLGATGRIANGFCQYLDAVTRLRVDPDAAVANLHTDAIARSARTADDAARHGDAVAEQLSALVSANLGKLRVR
jgi:chemotaxis protein histidine kinase CheA